MKRLIVVRHGKSSWDNLELRDHDRSITSIGQQKTLKIADFLHENGIKPDLILSSTALRAVETAHIICSVIGYDEQNIVLRKSLYLADEDDIFNELFELDNDIECVMIVGHNPGLTYFVNKFNNHSLENLSTSGVVCIDFKTMKWETIVSSKYKVRFIVTPKMLI